MFTWYELLLILLCIAVCVYAFVDKKYVNGIIYTVFTIIGTINIIRANLKNKKKWYKYTIFAKLKSLSESRWLNDKS